MKKYLLIIILCLQIIVSYGQIVWHDTITITASKKYNPPIANDGIMNFISKKFIKIPNALSVTHGNAGNHSAYLEINNGRKKTRIYYEGGANESHPTTTNQITKGKKYLFEENYENRDNDNNLRPGDIVEITSVKLHLNNGDNKAGTTIVNLPLALGLTAVFTIDRCANGPTILKVCTSSPINTVTWNGIYNSSGSTSASCGYQNLITIPTYIASPINATVTFTDGTSPLSNSNIPVNNLLTPIVPTLTATPNSVCPGNLVTLKAAPAQGIQNWTGSNLNTTTGVTVTANPISSSTYTATSSWAFNACKSSASINVVVPVATVNAGSDQSICTNTVNLNGTRGGGSTGATWSGGAGTFSPNANTLNAVYTPTTAEKTAGSVTLTLTATGSPCGNVSDQVVINLSTPPTANAGVDQSAVDCNSNMFTLSGSVTSPATGGVWMGGTGTFTPNNTSLNAVYTMSVAEINAGGVTLTLTTTGGLCGSAGDQVVLKSKKLKPIWTTFFGGSGADNIEAMDVDPFSHDIVVAGFTDGTTQTLPITPGITVIRSIGTMGLGKDAFAARISADGNTVRWITYIGGTAEDKSDGIRFDAAGNIYWTGTTESLNFPTTVAGYPSDNVGETPFVCRMNGDGSIVWTAAYMQGFEAYSDGITVTNDNHAIGGTIFITGSYDTQISCRKFDLFAIRINKITGQQIWMSFFGGPDIDCPGDNGNCIVHDAIGNIYIGGSSYGDASDGSIDLTCAPNPTPALNFAAKEAPGLLYTNNTHTGTVGQYADAIAVKFDANGTLQSWQMTGGLLHDSYIGVALMPNGEVVFVGYYDFVGNPGSILLTRTNANLSGIEKQVIHGNISEYGLGISIDAQGKVYIVGNSISTDLYSKFGSPTAYRTAPTGGWDMFMARMQVQGGSLKADWFSYYGSDPLVTGTPSNENGLTVAADSDGSFYAAGATGSDNFEWITSPIQKPSNRFTGVGNPDDGAIIKFTCNGTNSVPCPGCRTGLISGQDENNTESILGNNSPVQIYPNPFSNELNILINGGNGTYTIEISDTKGILVYSKENVSANIVNVVGDKFSSGVYILKVISEKETVTTKLIKTE